MSFFWIFNLNGSELILEVKHYEIKGIFTSGLKSASLYLIISSIERILLEFVFTILIEHIFPLIFSFSEVRISLFPNLFLYYYCNYEYVLILPIKPFFLSLNAIISLEGLLNLS